MRTSRSHRRRPKKRARRGAILILTVLLLVLLMAMLALSIDTGYMYTVQTQLDRSVDAAALAGASALPDGTVIASDQVVEYMVRNPVGSGDVIANESQLAQYKAEWLEKYGDDFEMEWGEWNPDTGQLEPTDGLPSAVRVSVEYPNNPLFFARVLGRDKFSVRAESIAMFQPRDIMLVLDLSASMNDDSEFRSRWSIGMPAIEENLEQIYEELGSPTYGNMQFDPVYIYGSTSYVKEQLGLESVAYPYPSGSWSDYISYVKYDSDVYYAGYRNHYGYMTLVNYWLERKPAYSETPDLWECSAQPITAVKDAVDVFVDYVTAIDTDDRIGLSVYNASNGNGKIEAELTSDFDAVVAMCRQRQAGHYHSYTNIGGGMEAARDHLEANGRPGAFKMIVLMTDGQANWVNGGYSTYWAENYVISEANKASELRYPIITVSLGAGADVDLMDEVAEITEGVHFNVPGGQTVSEYRADLLEVFREIADHRPLKLVK